MVVVILILLSLAVAGFIMLSDTRKNDNFERLEQRDAASPEPAEPAAGQSPARD
jgi:hypothetical protein